MLAWAADGIDSDVLQEIERSQAEDIKQAWRDAAEAELTQREIEQFAEDPPDKLDGWTKLDANHDGVEVAYVADNHGTPSVAAVFEGADSEVEALSHAGGVARNDGSPRQAASGYDTRLTVSPSSPRTQLVRSRLSRWRHSKCRAIPALSMVTSQVHHTVFRV